MARFKGAEAIYEVADLFRQRCLIARRSLLWPDVETWTPATISRLYSAFIDHPDESSRSFLEKWHDQLADQPEEVHRVASDVIALYFLFPSEVSRETKLKAVREVIGWKIGTHPKTLALLEVAFTNGIGSAGTFFQMGRPWQIAFFLDFARTLQDHGIDPTDWEACARLADEVRQRNKGSEAARHILLHLLFPEHFERIASAQHKKRIVEAFPQFAAGATDQDDALARIRAALVDQTGRQDVDFYDSDIRPVWSPSVWLFQANPNIYNLAEELKTNQVGDEDNWLVSRYRQEMGPKDIVLLWQGGPSAGIYAVGELTGAPFQRPTAEYWPDRDERPDFEWAVPFRYTNILTEPIRKPDLRRHPLLRDLQVIQMPQGTNFKVTPEEWLELEKLIPPPIKVLAELTHLAESELQEVEDLLLEKKQLVFEGPPGSGKTFVARLFARYFSGNPLDADQPPDQRVELLQFHQSYGYEDFVQGIRPVTDEEGRLQYHVLPGTFMRLCELAASNPKQRFVLIIDEINRGNLSRIFGELLLLLEYRNERVRLPYGAVAGSTEPAYLSIPDNLYVIGTMNSTDRSLALIDYALRRRFYFYQFLPVVNGRALVLERWLSKQEMPETERERTLQYFLKLNSKVQQELSPDFQIGHSYFMTQQIGTVTGLDRVWRYALRPLLAEYFHNSRDLEAMLAGFAPDRLLPTAGIPALAPDQG